MLESIKSPEQIRHLSEDELKMLAEEIRRELVKTVSSTGGHLASNLGVVELTLALHTAFDTPKDKLVFDVGHQAYVHKLITGRAELFGTLRQKDGLCGFPKPGESVHDAFTAGHASTAISAALGMARARDLRKQDHAVVAIVGDGALTGGMCYEALNDAGQSGTPLVVVLNDNEMSISRNVGALSGYLTNLRQSGPYKSFKRVVRSVLDKLPYLGKPLMRFIERIRDSLRSLLVDGQFFEALGFEYQGPIDGYDMPRLIRVLRRAKAANRPVLVHVITQKGRGFAPAESDPDGYHGIAPFFLESGANAFKGVPSYGAIMGEHLCSMAAADERVVAVCAAMSVGTGLEQFRSRYPGRFFDVGIAEEHAVTMAAGLAFSGLRPYVAIYSTFLQRAYDQLMLDVCLAKLPVTLLIDRAGLVGADGSTHQGVFDLSYLSAMPGMSIAAPRDAHELKRLLDLSLTMDGPLAIRYPRDGVDMGDGMRCEGPLKLGEWELLHEGKDVMILAVGSMVELALRASIELHGKGVQCGVIDARFVKPLDEAMLVSAVKGSNLIVTLEQNSVVGGFGALVTQRLSELGIGADIMALGVPDRFIEHGTISEQLDDCGLSPDSLARRIFDRVNADGR